MSKTESRFKSKLESLKKFQHSASTNSAVEKARAFFRSLELKHLSSSGERSSSRRRPSTKNSSSKIPLPSSICSSSSSSIIDDSHPTSMTDSTLNPIYSSNGIATARIIRVITPNYSNSNDSVVHRLMNNEGEQISTYSNVQPKFVSIPIQTQNSSSKIYPIQINNERSQSYSVATEKTREMNLKSNSHPLSSVSAMHSNVTYSSPMSHPLSSTCVNRSSLPIGDFNHHSMSTSLYHYRPLVCRQMESPSLMSSSFHEQSLRSDPIIRPLSSSISSSSMTTWNQSVRRLNSEYASTINALQRAKASLEQLHSPSKTNTNSTAIADTISKYANLVARGISDLSNHSDIEPKRSLGTAFCVTTPISEDSLSSLSSISRGSMEQMKSVPTTTIFSKPTLIRPKELDSFVPSIPSNLPKLESIQSVKQEKIANIIKKFNELNTLTSLSTGKTDVQSSPSPTHQNPSESLSQTIVFDVVEKPKENLPSIKTHCERIESAIRTFELKEIPDESPRSLISSTSSSSSSFSEDSTSSKTSSSDENSIYPPDHNENVQEETTYTVETIYKPVSIVDQIRSSSSHPQQVVIVRENTTAEQFQLAYKKQQHEDPPQHRFTMNQTQVPPLTTPLLTYLNLTLKQTPSPSFTHQVEEEKIDDNYQSIESVSNKSNAYFDQSDEIVRDVVTINPHPYSPPLSSSSHRLISSSSSSSTGSSASTVLLTENRSIAETTTPSISKVNHSTISHLPKRTNNNVSRLKPPSKIVSSTSKLKAPSSTNTKSIKPMITNNSTAMTTSMRKPTGITNQSSTMTNTIVNKSIHQQTSIPTLTSGKKLSSTNGIGMTESPNSADSSMTIEKNRVRSMVNQLNAASRSTTTPNEKRIPTVVNLRRSVTNETPSTTIIRPTLQRAMTVNHNSSITPSTPPTMTHQIPSNVKRKAPLIRSTSNVKEGLLRWCQAQVIGYPNVSVTNLSSSWSDGLAFCALTHHFFPDAFDFKSLSSQNRKENFELAFRVAEERGGVPRLLDVSDMIMMGNTPDYKCIFTYLNSFLAKVKDLHPKTNSIEH